MTQFANMTGQQQAQLRQHTVAAMPTEQETNSFVHSRQRQLIPINFVVLESQMRNNLGAAEDFGKPGYERYFFFYGDKSYYLDINLGLMRQLGLVQNQNCKHAVYIAKELLDRETTRGGITVDNTEEIILVKPETILEREVQTDLTNQEIDETINTLQEANAWLETNKNELTEQIQAREARIDELEAQNEENKTQTRREKTELEERLNTLQTNLVNGQETNQNLQAQSILLQALIIALQNQVNNLTVERDNRPNISLTTYDSLVNQRNIFRSRYLSGHEIINNVQVALGIDSLNNLPALPHGENLNNLLTRPTRRQLEQLEREKEAELDNLEELLNIKNAKIVDLVDKQNNLSQERNQLIEEKERLEIEKQGLRAEIGLATRIKEELEEQLNIYRACEILGWGILDNESEDLPKIKKIMEQQRADKLQLFYFPKEKINEIFPNHDSTSRLPLLLLNKSTGERNSRLTMAGRVGDYNETLLVPEKANLIFAGKSKDRTISSLSHYSWLKVFSNGEFYF